MIPTSSIQDDGKCATHSLWPSPMIQRMVGIVIVSLEYILPFIILIYCYSKIFVVIRGQVSLGCILLTRTCVRQRAVFWDNLLVTVWNQRWGYWVRRCCCWHCGLGPSRCLPGCPGCQRWTGWASRCWKVSNFYAQQRWGCRKSLRHDKICKSARKQFGLSVRLKNNASDAASPV